MKAISIKQPWAAAIIHHGKDIENRTWRSNYRGELFIHASKGFDKEGYRFLIEKGIFIQPEWFTLPGGSGGIIGKVQMVDCITESESEWFVGPFGFKLEKPEPISFIPMKGRLSIFDW